MSHDPTALVLHAVKEVSQERLVKAVCGLADGTLSVTLTRQTDSEIRALVRNGEGHEYGVCLAANLTTCSCKDAMYRGVVCKHQVAVALYVLRTPHAEAPAPQETLPTPASRTHLLWSDGAACCGAIRPEKSWPWPRWTPTMTTWPEACAECARIYRNGYDQHHQTPATARIAA